MTNILASKTVLITGASRGIGYATARAFLQAGARIAITGQEVGHLTAAATGLQAFGEVMASAGDVRRLDEVRAVVAAVVERYGAIDVLVNNAGRAWMGAFVEQDPASIDESIDVNLKGVLYMTHVVLPHMLRQRGGAVINVASGAGRTGFAGLATYCASKFGVVGFTESLAGEVQDAGVRVYAICPGAVATDMQREITGAPVGMAPARVAAQILALAGPHPPIGVGECLENL
jgi:3-oxoacyl-[acyl-carrier protein] reductase